MSWTNCTNCQGLISAEDTACRICRTPVPGRPDPWAEPVAPAPVPPVTPPSTPGWPPPSGPAAAAPPPAAKPSLRDTGLPGITDDDDDDIHDRVTRPIDVPLRESEP